MVKYGSSEFWSMIPEKFKYCTAVVHAETKLLTLYFYPNKPVHVDAGGGLTFFLDEISPRHSGYTIEGLLIADVPKKKIDTLIERTIS